MEYEPSQETNKVIEEKITQVAAALTSSSSENLVNAKRDLISGQGNLGQGNLRKNQLEIEQDLRTLLKRIDEGLEEIFKMAQQLQSFEPEIFSQEAMQGITYLIQNVWEFKKITLDSLLDLEKNEPIKNLLSISNHAAAAIYRASTQIYNEGRFKEAASAFTVVTLLDASLHDGWVALGNAEVFCKRPKSALVAYALAAISQPANPTSHLLAAQCYETLKEYSLALNSLEIAQKMLSDDPQQTDLVKKAEEHKQHLLKLMEK